jgi:photosystem I subunit XI
MVINKSEKFGFLNVEETLTITSTGAKKTDSKISGKSFDVVSSFEGDPFVGHLSTPITTSALTKTYLKLLPAYKAGLSPLLRGINIGYVHGYFLLGPFVKLGPLRDSQVANFVGFVSTISLIIILTTALLIYGYVTFSNKKTENASPKKSVVDFLNAKGWSQFTSGFIVGGFGGTSVAYILLKLINFDIAIG